MARKSEIVFVVGDKKSANTRRLREICEETGAKTYQIGTAADLDLNLTKGFDTIGITAGASTPDRIIEEVIAKLKGA
jgi:4-hydroxy-3-methylbut-2-enyl diphosphate reductase